MKKLRPLINKGEFTLVPVYQSGTILYATIDNEDAEMASKYLWSMTKNHYPKTSNRNAPMYGYLHRMILLPNPTEKIDHIDGDKLNNRRNNLRIVTNQQNQMARHAAVSRTGYKGVYKRGNLYRASIKYNQKEIRLGTYPTPHKAARAYNQAALALFGEYAVINDIKR